MAVLRIVCLVLGVLLGCGSRVLAQGLPIALPTLGPTAPDIRQEGLFVSAPVVLDGATLFRIAAPATAPPGQIPLAERVTIIESVLQQIVSPVRIGNRTTTAYDPATLRIQIERGRGQATLTAIDKRHRVPLPVLTVTSVDAKYNHTNVDALAVQWRAILQSALVHALQIRQPASERRSLDDVLRGGAALLVLTALLLVAVARLRARIEALEDELLANERALAGAQEQRSTSPAPEHAQRRRRIRFALGEIGPQQRLRFYGALAALLLWLALLAWFIAVSWGLSLFPQTAALSRALWQSGLGVATIWIVTGLIDRILTLTITRAAAAMRMRPYATPEERTRMLLRVPTIAHTVSSFKTFVLVFVALLTTLSQLGVPVGSVVTVGGVVAIGVSLAAQNIMRDFLNGFLVLFEDQYVVGDFVTINGYTGLVEHLNLRMAQLRDAAGNLITIPHGTVSGVVNHSRNWSRVDYRVSVDPHADPVKAIEILRTTLEEMSRDQRWHGAILTPVESIGIDSFTRDWLLLRASVKTAPLRQYELRREINAHVLRALEEAGIAPGAPVPSEFIPPA
jgi:small conductance mechanosensitive channel